MPVILGKEKELSRPPLVHLARLEEIAYRIYFELISDLILGSRLPGRRERNP